MDGCVNLNTFLQGVVIYKYFFRESAVNSGDKKRKEIDVKLIFLFYVNKIKKLYTVHFITLIVVLILGFIKCDLGFDRA